MTGWITPEQAAEHLPRFTAAWVRRQLRVGSLAGSKIGGKWLTTTTALADLVEGGSNSVKTRKRGRRAS
jgi:hypothetical protein